jgi:hypothetical protein
VRKNEEKSNGQRVRRRHHLAYPTDFPGEIHGQVLDYVVGSSHVSCILEDALQVNTI